MSTNRMLIGYQFNGLKKIDLGNLTNMLHVPRMQQNSRSSPFVVKVLMLFQYMSIRMPSQASDECRWVPMFFRAPQMTDHFWHTGPNGRHKCMTFEAFKITENGNHLWNVLQVGLLYLYPQVILGLLRPGDGGEPPGAGEALWLQWHSFGPMSQALKARLKLFSMISMMFHVRFSAFFFDKTLWWEMPGWNFRSSGDEERNCQIT